MTFAEFIKKYYLPHQQKELVAILSELCVYSDIEISLNDFFQTTEKKNRIEIISHFVLTISEYITVIKRRLYEMKPSDEKSKKESKIIELSVYLIRETYESSMLEKKEYFDLFKQTARKIYLKYSYDFSIIECLLSPENLKTFSNAADATNQKRENKFSKPIRFEWKGNIHLDLFIDDLVKIFRHVKSKKQIYLLFDMVESDFKIELPSKSLIHFLTLFYKLHECGAIKVIGNRGLFVYLEQHLRPPLKDKYPIRDFRKLRHEAEHDEKSKTEINKIINPLLTKYCNNGQ